MIRTILTDYDHQQFIRFLGNKKRPYTVEVTDGRRRSVSQNRLQRLWLNEAAEQLGDRTAEELRGEMKLTFGVPILRAEDEAFREAYDAIFKPLPYHLKVRLMMEPFDFAVTRKMTIDQKTRYLNAVAQHLLELGCVLTEPPDRMGAAA